MSVLHPAGMKRFSTLSQEAIVPVTVETSRDIYVDSVTVSDNQTPSETFIK